MNNQYNHSGGRVLWLTGLSGAGKSTLAAAIQKLLLSLGHTPLVLDGDQVRAAIEDPYWGFDSASRLKGSYRYSKLACMAAKQGTMVIVPTISLFHEVHRWNREHIPGYYEVYLKTNEATRRLRDPKILYKNHGEGIETSMVGLGENIEAPLMADLVIENNGTAGDIEAIANKITNGFLANNSLTANHG